MICMAAMPSGQSAHTAAGGLSPLAVGTAVSSPSLRENSSKFQIFALLWASLLPTLRQPDARLLVRSLIRSPSVPSYRSKGSSFALDFTDKLKRSDRQHSELAIFHIFLATLSRPAQQPAVLTFRHFAYHTYLSIHFLLIEPLKHTPHPTDTHQFDIPYRPSVR